jgi:hypothetical protein
MEFEDLPSRSRGQLATLDQLGQHFGHRIGLAPVG